MATISITSLGLGNADLTAIGGLSGTGLSQTEVADAVVEGDKLKKGNKIVNYDGHLASTSNPHSTTAGQVGAYTKGEVDGLVGAKLDKNTAIVGATKTKITYDAKGLVTGGADLAEADIPTLSQSKITNLTTDLSGKLDKNANITGATKTKITYDAKGLVTGGEALTEGDIPTLSQSKITNLTTDLASKEISANKKTDMETNKLSDTFYPSIKSVYDWAKGLFVTNQTLSDALVGKADKVHTHSTSDITGLDITLSNKVDKSEVLGSFGNLSSPLLDLPLKNSLNMKAGVGSTTFTRASTATYIDRYRVLKTANVDEPRFEKEGYLNEGSSTNLVTNSSVFTHPEWGVATNTLVGGHPSPDGANNATLATTINADSCAIYKSVVFSANTATISIFAKAGTSSSLSLRFVNYDTNLVCQFNLANKTVSDTKGKIIELSNGWFRCSLSTTFTGTDLDGSVYCYTATNAGTNYNSNIGNSMYIYGFQAEALSFASSYIPTTTSTVTRSADVLQVTRENNFPNAENNAQGYSVAFAYDSLGILSTAQGLWSLRVDTQNYVQGYLTTTTNSLRNFISKGGVSVNNLTIPVNPLGSNRVVQIQSNTFLKQYINGILADTDVNTLGTLVGGVNSITNITIGGLSGLTTSNIYGHISDFKVYDKELTPMEVSLL